MTRALDVLIFPVCLTMALCADGLADKPAVLLAGAGILLLAFGAVRALSGHKKSRPRVDQTHGRRRPNGRPRLNTVIISRKERILQP